MTSVVSKAVRWKQAGGKQEQLMEKRIVRKSVRFFGIVQGVGFRYKAIRAARAAGATGWVRNEYDGSVTMEIQGTYWQIEQVISELQVDRFIRIEDMDVRRIDPVEGEREFRTLWS